MVMEIKNMVLFDYMFHYQDKIGMKECWIIGNRTKTIAAMRSSTEKHVEVGELGMNQSLRFQPPAWQTLKTSFNLRKEQWFEKRMFLNL